MLKIARLRRRAAVVILAALTPIAAILTVVAVPAANATTVPAPPPGWTTVFSDNFSGAAGTGVNPANWLYDTGTSYPGGAANWGTGEVESETNSTANVYQDGNGHLVIKPIDTNGTWTSGRIETQNSSFEAPAGGEMEMTASIEQPNPSNGLGYWPAFWAMGSAARGVGATNWPSIGEFDIMEDVNALSEVSHTFHCGVDPGGPCNETNGISSNLLACGGCQTGYHTYSIIVDRTNINAEQLRWYVDGNLEWTVSENQVPVATWQAAVDHGFFMILNVAMGGVYPNRICNCTTPTSATTSGAGMSVGYVAVYETTGGGSTTEAPYGGTAAAVPGTVQAENYDTGGQGVAYNVTSVNGSGNAYRSDGVDLEATTRYWRRLRPGLDRGRAVVQVHGQRRDGGHVHGRAARRRARGGHRRPAHRQQLGDEPERQRERPGHRRLPDLDDGERHRHPAGRHPDPDRGPGRRRLEPQLPHLRLRRRDRRHRGALRGDPGGGARDGAGGELRHRRAGHRLQRHRRQRHRQRLPDRRGRPGGHHRHRRRLQPGLDRGNTVVQVHRQRRDGGHLHGRPAPVASPAAVTDGLHIANSSGTNLSGNVNVPATGGYQTWATVIATVTLPAGVQTLTVDQDHAGWNINFLAFGTG